jgi:hypothetical protein
VSTVASVALIGLVGLLVSWWYAWMAMIRPFSMNISIALLYFFDSVFKLVFVTIFDAVHAHFLANL